MMLDGPPSTHVSTFHRSQLRPRHKHGIGCMATQRHEGDGVQMVAGGVQPEGRHLQDFADVSPCHLHFRVGARSPASIPPIPLPQAQVAACLFHPRHVGLAGLLGQRPICPHPSGHNWTSMAKVQLRSVEGHSTAPHPFFQLGRQMARKQRPLVPFAPAGGGIPLPKA